MDVSTRLSPEGVYMDTADFELFEDPVIHNFVVLVMQSFLRLFSTFRFNK